MAKTFKDRLKSSWIYDIHRFLTIRGSIHRPSNAFREIVRVPWIFDRVSLIMQLRQADRVAKIANKKPTDDVGEEAHYQKVYDHNANKTSQKQIITNRLSERLYAVAAVPIRDLKKEKLLSIGSRTVHELLIAWTQGFAWKNITGVDLYTTHEKIIPMNMENLQLEDSQFDCIVMANVLSYASDTRKALSEAVRVLKPGGRFVFNGTYDPNALELWPESCHSGEDLRKILGDLGMEIYFWHTREYGNTLGNVETDHLIGCYKPDPEDKKRDPVSL